MLVEQGKLSLDDDIRKYLPDTPDFGRVITVQHLLFHMSGLPDWPSLLVLSGTAPERRYHLGYDSRFGTKAEDARICARRRTRLFKFRLHPAGSHSRKSDR